MSGGLGREALDQREAQRSEAGREAVEMNEIESYTQNDRELGPLVAMTHRRVALIQAERGQRGRASGCPAARGQPGPNRPGRDGAAPARDGPAPAPPSSPCDPEVGRGIVVAFAFVGLGSFVVIEAGPFASAGVVAGSGVVPAARSCADDDDLRGDPAGRYARHAMRVAFVASEDTIRTVAAGGFKALPSDRTLLLREVGQQPAKQMEERAAALVEVPEDALSPFEQAEEQGQPRTFAVPPSVVQPFAILAYRTPGQPAAVTRRRRSFESRKLAAAVVALVLVAAVALPYLLWGGGGDRKDPARVDSTTAEQPPKRPARRVEKRPVEVRGAQAGRSRAVGSATAGRLVAGVALPAEGKYFFTWNIPEGRSPNPRFRRFATAGVVQRVLGVAADYALANPSAPRVGIGDLSLPRGGEFGVKYGGTGHVAHRNGTEVDILYPRRDGTERAAASTAEVDLRLAQDVLDRLLDAGAVQVVVDPNLSLKGPSGAIESAPYHEEHMHARFPQ